MHGLLIAPHSRPQYAPFGRGSEGLLYLAAAAASADTDQNDRVCVAGLGPCPLLRAATQARRHRSTSGLLQRTDCVHREHHEQSEELVT